MKVSAPRAAADKPVAPATAKAPALPDNRPIAVAQRQTQAAIDASPRQLAQRPLLAAPGHNLTGLPDRLKAGVESLSGHSLDDVRVHYNSAKPAQLQAHAYAQGTDIHLGPGQEQHLPHEAWHVVQQKQGRVRATMQMKGGFTINDNKSLESEADAMGAKALLPLRTSLSPLRQAPPASSSPIQCNTPGVLSGMAVGAAVGSFFPGIGTLIGAVAGGLLGHIASPRSSWYDATAKQWRRFESPHKDSYRLVKPDERNHIIPEFNKKYGFKDSDDAPVYVKKTHQSSRPGLSENDVPPDGPKHAPAGIPTNSTRTPVSRMLDRMGREMVGGTSSPHLALVKLENQIFVAGNTGGKKVKTTQQPLVEATLKKRAKGAAIQGKNSSDAHERDGRKLVALQNGEYSHDHPEHQAELEQIADVVRTGNLTWVNVGVGGKKDGSIHGEMALLDHVQAHIAGQAPAQERKKIPMAGVKKDCLFCQWAHDIFNIHVAHAQNYTVVTGGTSGIPFPGWKAPKWMMDTPPALAEMRRRVEDFGNEWTMPADRVLYEGPELPPPAAAAMHQYESDTDREDND